MVDNNSTNDISLYLRSIAKVPLLKRAEEMACGVGIVENRRKIIDRMLASRKGIEITFKHLERIGSATEEDDLEDDAKDKLQQEIKAWKDTSHFNAPSPTRLAQILFVLAQTNDLVFNQIITEYKATLKNPSQILKWEAKGKAARDLLVSSNLRLVVSIAKQYTSTGTPFLDLIQEGTIGLIKAADKFDPHKPSKFSTLATWWVRQAIIRNLSNKSRTIRIPVHMVFAMNRAIRELMEIHGRHPTPLELLERLKMPNLTELHVKEILSIMGGMVSLSEPMGTEENNETYTMQDAIKDETTPMDETLSDSDLHGKMLALFATLSPREEKILRLKIGL